MSLTARRPRPRVLLIAEAANPEWVSVPLIGWSLSQALTEVAHVHLVTQIRNREAILRAGLIEGVDFTAIDSEAIARPIWAIAERLRGGAGKGWTMMQLANAVSYPWFEHLLWRQFGPGIRAGDWDIVHRITPLSPTIGSPLAAKCARAGVPFVIGPINGGVPWPKGFADVQRKEREWLSSVRRIHKLMPGHRSTFGRSAAIIAGSRHTAAQLPAPLRERVVMIPENGVDPNRFNRHARMGPGPLRVCFIGRMVPYKGPDMLLEAAGPLLAAGRMTLEMIGDGPLLTELHARSAAAGLKGVTFHGWLDHLRVQEVAAGCSVLGLPSIREFGGGVVVEAMSLGLVPLIVDYAGPPELVTPETAVKVPLTDRAGIVRGFRAALEQMADDPEGVAAMGAWAAMRVQSDLTWAAKAAQIAQVHDWVLGRGDKPCPFPDMEIPLP